jgi:glutaredoxin domain-containing cysteine-rich protein 1
MGCTVSKDAVETIRKSRSAQIDRGMSMPVQAQGNRDNGYHMVALTSSTYGTLKVEDPKIDDNSASLSDSSHDAFYEKFKNFDVPDEMVAKSWSEVSRNLPKIPPPTRTDSPRWMDSPRLQTRGINSPRHMGSLRGMDSPRQRGNFWRMDSPHRLPSQATKSDHDTINTWELMDGLDEDGDTFAKPKLKPLERIPGSPVIRPFNRSITFSSIHTLSELDSGDPSKAIAHGQAGIFLNSSKSVDSGGKENTIPVRAMTRSASLPDPWAGFELKSPPAGEDRVVLYTTSLRGILKTFEDCNNARFIFKSFNIDIDERDVSIHAEFRHELKELTGKPGPIPQVFIKGRYIGGMDIITQLHEDGTLASLVDGLPPQLSRGECDGCGGVRFVPCSDCSGSTKVLNEAKEVVRCSECNENGLMRCPICN